jgi:hypothetical protein
LRQNHCLFDWRVELLLGDPGGDALAGAVLTTCQGTGPWQKFGENKTAEAHHQDVSAAVIKGK